MAENFDGLVDILDSNSISTIRFDAEQADIQAGNDGRAGNMSARKDDGDETVRLNGGVGTVIAGGSEVAGHVREMSEGGYETAHLSGATGNLYLVGGGQDGDVRLKNGEGDETLTLNGGGSDTEAGGGGAAGSLTLKNTSGIKTVTLEGQTAELALGSQGVDGRLKLSDSLTNLGPKSFGRMMMVRSVPSLVLVFVVVAVVGVSPSLGQRTASDDCGPTAVSVILASGEALPFHEDLDDDGVLNGLEVCGYTFDTSDAGFRACRDSDEECYFTDPRQKTTDGDPYSDGLEVSRINFPRTILDPGRSPLVPAFPSIAVVLEGMEVIPVATITDATGKTLKADVSIGGSVSATLGGEVSGNCKDWEVVIAECEAGAKVSTSLTTSANWQASAEAGFSWETSTTTNPAEAAHLKLRVYYLNSGLAPAHQVVPTLNILLGGNSIATFKPSDAIGELAGGERYPQQGNEAIDKDDKGDFITLSLAELLSLQAGAPLRLSLPQVSAKIQEVNSDAVSSECGDEWKCWEAEILMVSASVEMRIGVEDAPSKTSRYLVYVGGPDTKEKTTVGEVLPRIFNVEERDGQRYINGLLYPGDWQVLWSPLDSAEEKPNSDLFEYVLGHGDQLTLLHPTATERPLVGQAWFSRNLRQVYATVQPNTLPTAKVIAHVMEGGASKEVELHRDDTLGYYASDEFAGLLSPLLKGQYAVAIDSKKNASEEKDIGVAASFKNCKEIQGGGEKFLSGDYVLFFDGDQSKPFVIFCDQMETTDPIEYLTLVAPDDAKCLDNRSCKKNFSLQPASDPPGTQCCDHGTGYWIGTDVMTRFDKIRLDVEKLRVGVSDLRHARSIGEFQVWQAEPRKPKEKNRGASYGAAVNCTQSTAKSHKSPGMANIDLTGTPFVIASTPEKSGYEAWGEVIDSTSRTATMRGGGVCGGIGAEVLNQPGELILRYRP